MKYDMKDGWRKITPDSGGSYVTTTLFNVNTGEVESICVRDYDYSDGSRDCDEWYYAPVDEEAYLAYCKKFGIVAVGLKAMVVKGRKIEKGYVGEVVKMRKVNDKFGRFLANYVVFADGKSTNVANCVLVCD